MTAKITVAKLGVYKAGFLLPVQVARFLRIGVGNFAAVNFQSGALWDL